MTHKILFLEKENTEAFSDYDQASHKTDFGTTLMRQFVLRKGSSKL